MAAPRKVKKLQIIPGGKGGQAAPGAIYRASLPTAAIPDGHYEALFQSANDAIMLVDLENDTITNANTAALELTGYLPEDLVGRSLDVLIPKNEQVDRFTQPLSRQHIASNGFFEDIVLAARDGYPRFVSLSAKTVVVGGGRVALCILRDVAEKKNMERDLITKHSELRNAYIELERANANLKSMQETLVQSGKLAALGELAAGIAHELNQPLTAVKGFAQEAGAVLGKSESDAAVRGYLEEVVRGAEKMERIISHLRNFTRKSTEDFRWVDVHGVIDESLLMLEKQLQGRGIRVEKNYGSALPKVYCNPFQLEQVFINLATNARDAIEAKREGRGLITIRTHSPSEGMLEVVYGDDGCGIAENAKGKIFNPFFTTKEVGKGMGLGLSISYGILSRIHASILVESSMGKGTVFTIKLPVDYRKH